MPKIEISEDQNTVTMDGAEFVFIPYTIRKNGICGVNGSKCDFYGNCSITDDIQIPCVERLRVDMERGYFKRKQK